MTAVYQNDVLELYLSFETSKFIVLNTSEVHKPFLLD